MSPGQRVLLLDMQRGISQDEMKAATIRDLMPGTVEAAMLDIIAKALNEISRKVGGMLEPAVDQLSDRPDLRVDHCAGTCGHMTSHRYLRGEWICVVCETATEPRRSLRVVTNPCECSGRGTCQSCVLDAYDNPDDATLMQCCACERFWVWDPRSRGYCPHCGSGDTGRAEGDARPERSDITATFAPKPAAMDEAV